jgi:hypothetical protein
MQPFAESQTAGYISACNGWAITTVQADLHDAHDRHWSDAEKPHAETRWANADHLYGLAVECGLKRLMYAFGMKLGSDGSPAIRADRKHADQLWAQYEAYRSGHNAGGRYVLPAANPFGDWSVDQRYASRQEFDATRVNAHRLGADFVRRLLGKAVADGLIA